MSSTDTPSLPPPGSGPENRGTDDDETIHENLKFGLLCPNCGCNKFHLHREGSTSCARCGLVHLHSQHFGWMPLVEDKNLEKD